MNCLIQVKKSILTNKSSSDFRFSQKLTKIRMEHIIPHQFHALNRNPGSFSQKLILIDQYRQISIFTSSISGNSHISKSANFHSESAVFDPVSTTEAYCGHTRYSIKCALKFFIFKSPTYEIFIFSSNGPQCMNRSLPSHYKYRNGVTLFRKQRTWD